jgi:hypothetical protein
VSVIERTYAHVMPQVAPDLSFADMGRKWGGTGMITPFRDINVESEVSDTKKESDGDPGAIRTRDPQLRRLGGLSKLVSNIQQLQRSCPASKWPECG